LSALALREMTEQEPLVINSARRHGVTAADAAGRLLEVGVVESRDEPGLVIVHAMPARQKFLRR
jgi:hypothetical protein